MPRPLPRPLALLLTAAAAPFVLTGCLYASLLTPFLPSGPQTPDLSGNYSNNAGSVTLCGTELRGLVYVTVERFVNIYDEDAPPYYRFDTDIVIENVPGSYGTTNVTRSASWEVVEASDHAGVAYGSPFISYFGRMSLQAVQPTFDEGETPPPPYLVGSALLIDIRYQCEGTMITGNAELTFELQKD